MRTTPVPLVVLLLVASIPVLCDKEEPPVSHLEPPSDTWPRFAPLDDVHLLSNGLLQLGRSMQEFVQKTKGQISSIFQKLNIFDRSFYQLSALTSRIKEEEEELKKTTVILKADNDEIKGLSERISSKVESILQERSRLQNKVGDLEEKLSGLSPGLVTNMKVAEIISLRAVIQNQELSITELLNEMTEQSEQLNLQKMKIKLLEEKLTASMLAQDTLDKMPDFSEVPTLAPFLNPGSSSSRMMNLPSDCSELFHRGERASGIYSVKPNASQPFMVYCEMSKERGATVIQRRSDGSLKFDQPWETYENGFGDLQGEFWLGLKKIHFLTSQVDSVLRIQLEDWKQNRRSSEYRFHLDGPESNYTIHLTRLSGNLPDPLSNHTGVAFSTTGRGNQRSRCAHQRSGGWWFSVCGDNNLNGRYFHMRPNGRRRGIQWRTGRKVFYSLRSTQISISHGIPASLSSDSSVFP